MYVVRNKNRFLWLFEGMPQRKEKGYWVSFTNGMKLDDNNGQFEKISWEHEPILVQLVTGCSLVF